MKNAPCGSCPDKGCGSYHTTCPKYLAWRSERDSELNAKSKTLVVREYTYDTVNKKKEYRRKKKKR